jgi:hypothetical protein
MSMNNFLAAIEENRQLIDAQVASFQGTTSSATPSTITDDTLLEGVIAADLQRMRNDLRGLDQVLARTVSVPTVTLQIEDGSAQAAPPETT